MASCDTGPARGVAVNAPNTVLPARASSPCACATDVPSVHDACARPFWSVRADAGLAVARHDGERKPERTGPGRIIGACGNDQRGKQDPAHDASDLAMARR